MSSDQPPPGPGETPDDDPLRKGPPSPPPDGGPPGAGPPGGAPSAGHPYGAGPPEGSPYGGSPYGGAPYGDPYGSPDPLAGMPPLASRGRRLLARIIDSLLIGIPVGVLMTFLVGGYSSYNPADPDKAGSSAVVQIVVMLAYFVYEALMLTASGQTVGKKVMRIRVAMLENGSVPAGQAGWFRAATYTVPQIVPCCGFVFWLVNALWCTWDKPYQQCLHDKVGKTVVVAAG